jgi:hypothetical protein
MDASTCRLVVCALAFSAVLACGPGFTGDGTSSTGETLTTTVGTSTVTTTLGDGDGDGDWRSDTSDTGNEDGANAADILFVVDNSGSMGEEQQKLALAIDALVDPLEAADVDYRIGITTSDNGNPWCPSGTTTPEGGKLVLSSCKNRIEDFLFNNGQVDVQDLACNDLCALDNVQLEIQPTTTDLDDNASPRPWVESAVGVTNLPPGTDVADALRCFMPMGINGCGFESQLESMYLSLKRAVNTQEASYGFLRADSVLAIVFLSDEADCSYNKDYASIFEQDGDKVFWSDPTASFPTSAVCWNAGVTCTGDPSAYTSCDPVNKDELGNEAVDDAAAVLHPMSRYLGELAGLTSEKQELQFDREIVLGLIGGVETDGSLTYADVDATDPEFQDSFGIGPGCTAPNPLDPNEPVEAVPPVRMRDAVEMGGVGGLYSVCDADYSAALADVATNILAEI